MSLVPSFIKSNIMLAPNNLFFTLPLLKYAYAPATEFFIFK